MAQRFLSIDIARGLTIAAMILVNDPGDPHEVYPPLRHADWNGYTAADLVFPNFLFLAGSSLVFSLQTRIESGKTAKYEIARALGRRSVNLLLLKLFIAQLPTFRRRRIRIFGVLFRTAFCSLAAGLILLRTRSLSSLLAIISAILGGYFLALRTPIGTLNHPLLDPDNNLAAWFDRRIAHLLHGHLHNGALYNVTHDPEGLLSSLPALATVLAGACAALVLRAPKPAPVWKAGTLALAGAASLGAGHAWHRRFPINKNLWTSSYALIAGGWSLLSLALIYAVYDVRRPSRLMATIAKPASIFGANALVAYTVSVAGHKIVRTLQVSSEGHQLSLRSLVYRKVFARAQSTPLRSAVFAITYAAFCFMPNLILWRRKIFVKV